MKRIGFGIFFVLLIFAAALQAQSSAQAPGPEHKKLNIWVGDWTYEGESFATPLQAADKYAGKMTVRPILDGFFVEFQGEDGSSRWHEIDGYDALNKTYFWFGFGNNGKVDTATYTIEGTKVEYSGSITVGEKRLKIRGTVVFADDLKSSVEKRDISLDGQSWIPSFRNNWKKIK
jgi:hypothetical protein